jgi:hypothetical protein
MTFFSPGGSVSRLDASDRLLRLLADLGK